MNCPRCNTSLLYGEFYCKQCGSLLDSINQYSETKSFISQYLKLFLPQDLHLQCDEFADLLMAAMNEMLQPEVINFLVDTNPKFLGLIKGLEGRVLKTPQTSKLVSFGEGSNIGDVTIRDIAQGNIIKLHFNLNQHPTPQRTAPLSPLNKILRKVEHQIAIVRQYAKRARDLQEQVKGENLANETAELSDELYELTSILTGVSQALDQALREQLRRKKQELEEKKKVYFELANQMVGTWGTRPPTTPLDFYGEALTDRESLALREYYDQKRKRELELRELYQQLEVLKNEIDSLESQI